MSNDDLDSELDFSSDAQPISPDRRLRLERTEQELLTALRRHHGELAKFYHAAVVVRKDAVLPARLTLAAHALRELMEKLPNRTVGGDGAEDLNTRVKTLHRKWSDVLDGEDPLENNRWTNGIGNALRQFLVAAGAFFDWRATNSSNRRQLATRFIKDSDALAHQLPADEHKRNAARWMKLRKYFNNVSHRPLGADEGDFEDHVRELEQLLYALLNRSPVDDIDRIDELLAED